eukprot:1158274-Pelagomonas_calceolata.AAC.50
MHTSRAVQKQAPITRWTAAQHFARPPPCLWASSTRTRGVELAGAKLHQALQAARLLEAQVALQEEVDEVGVQGCLACRIGDMPNDEAMVATRRMLRRDGGHVQGRDVGVARGGEVVMGKQWGLASLTLRASQCLCSLVAGIVYDAVGTTREQHTGAPTLQDLDCHLEGEHELVLLKQPQARVAVDVKGQGLNDVVQPVLQHHILLAGVEGLVEYRQEGAQAVLVPVSKQKKVEEI